MMSLHLRHFRLGVRSLAVFAFSCLAARAHAQGTVGDTAAIRSVESAATRAARARLEPGDRIVVNVRRELLLSDTVTVNPRGEIVLARIGILPVATLTLAAFEDTLRARYAKFLRNPAVDLLVLRRIAVNGEVGKPDIYYVDVSMTLRDVIALAGGITDIGSDKRVWLVRRGVRTEKPDWQSDYSLASDLSSGDQIVVGKLPWLVRNAFSTVSSLAVLVSVFLSLRR